jgi:hypothetical protein
MKGDSPICRMEGYHRCGSTNTSYCVDEELLCDKFPHCLDESDEDESCLNRNNKFFEFYSYNFIFM